MDYTFGQFGLFVRMAYREKQDNRYVDFILNSFAAQPDKDSMNKVRSFLGIAPLKKGPPKRQEMSQEELEDNWSRLASTMGGFK
jgi:hypothetical protein